jgi:L-malate glycosyltransferase
MKASVAIIQRRLTHYRVPLFESLRAHLAERGIELRLLHGDPTEAERTKRDQGELTWAEYLPTRYFADGRLLWQPFANRVTNCDLIVVTQENKHLHNLPLVLNPWRQQKVAFWGHGRNLQSRNPNGVGERFKRWTTTRVDWWFVYTDLSAELVRSDGFPPDRITVLNNSIDTEALRSAIRLANQRPREEIRKSLGIGNGPVGLFMGSLYADKRIDFLLEAAHRLRGKWPSFELVIAGDGPERASVEVAAQRFPFVHYAGAVAGHRKAEFLAAADLMLNPGLVGLGILDAFAAALPIVTTDCKLHSPEVSYLDSGHNGLMTANDLQAFVRAAQSIVETSDFRLHLSEGAAHSSRLYSLNNMTAHFVAGIESSLDTRK